MSSSPTDVLVDVTMPQMGVSVAEGTVVAWRVEPGDRIEAEATICEISTDKIDTEVPAPATGVVAEILVPIGETVDVGTVLARIAVGGNGTAPAAAPAPAPAPSPDGGAAGPSATRPRRCARSPVATERVSASPRPGGPQRQPAVLPGRPADRRRARDRPLAGARHRPRRARPQAGRARARGGEPGRGAAAAHREPVPAGPVPPPRDAGRPGRRPPRRRPSPAPVASCRGCAGRSAST